MNKKCAFTAMERLNLKQFLKLPHLICSAYLYKLILDRWAVPTKIDFTVNLFAVVIKYLIHAKRNVKMHCQIDRVNEP